MQKEIYKDIPDTGGEYQVSNYGNVKSLKKNKPKVLTGGTNISGHRHYLLRVNGKACLRVAHVLVYEVFHNVTIDNRMQVVCHIDKDPLNNKLENLMLLSRGDYMKSSLKRGLPEKKLAYARVQYRKHKGEK